MKKILVLFLTLFLLGALSFAEDTAVDAETEVEADVAEDTSPDPEADPVAEEYLGKLKEFVLAVEAAAKNKEVDKIKSFSEQKDKIYAEGENLKYSAKQRGRLMKYKTRYATAISRLGTRKGAEKVGDFMKGLFGKDDEEKADKNATTETTTETENKKSSKNKSKKK